MKSFEISKIINEIYEGVERSIVGDICVKDENGQNKKGPDGGLLINHLSFNVFLAALSCLLPKNISGDFDVSGTMENKDKVNISAEVK